MTLGVGKVQNINFGARQQEHGNKEDENPITKGGERSKLVAGTFLAGIGFGTRALFELIDGDFIAEDIFEAGSKIADKNFKNSSNGKKVAAAIGASVGILGLFVAASALLYTAFHAPKINYDSKINTYTKTKDMDVYIKSNKIEKNLYEEINNKAKTADDNEKSELREQYALLKAAKNKVPAFANFGKTGD